MIVSERKAVVCTDYMIATKEIDMGMKFGEMMSDGRLTEPSDYKKYKLREAILYSKRLGRPLNKDEMLLFEV